MAVTITRKIVDSVKTSGTTRLGSIETVGLGSAETAGLEGTGSVWLGLSAARNRPNISGESFTLDASLVCHETKPVARMGLAVEVYGGPSSVGQSYALTSCFVHSLSSGKRPQGGLFRQALKRNLQ